MRPEITNLLNQGLLPTSKSDIQQIKAWQEAFEKITPPVSDEEAETLLTLFQPIDDDCFGLAWSLIHLIETSPGWPLLTCIQQTNNPWITRLRERSST
jgi:hypothetical protein